MRYSVEIGQDLLTEDNWTEYSIVIGGVLDQISMSSLYFHVLRSTFILMIYYYRMELMMTRVWEFMQVLLELKPRTLYILDKHSPSDPHSRPQDKEFLKLVHACHLLNSSLKQYFKPEVKSVICD